MRLDTGRNVPRLLGLAFTLTCLAYAWSFNRYSSKVFSFLWEEHGYSESFAGMVESAMVAALCLAAGCVWIERLRWLSLMGAAVLVLEMLAETGMPSAKYPYLYWAEWALRYGTPVWLMLFLLGRERARAASVLGIKVMIACVFVSHGVKALLSDPHFIDLILVSARRAGLELGEAQAVALLHVIGLSDLCLAALLLWLKSPRVRWVLMSIAVWGAVTAFSRVTYGGWGNGYEVLMRSSHFLAPIALLLVFRREPAASIAV